MSYKLSKYDAIEQIKRLRIDSIIFYMNDLHATSDSRVKWISEFIQYLKNDYSGNHDGLRACADEFNNNYWILDPENRMADIWDGYWG